MTGAWQSSIAACVSAVRQREISVREIADESIEALERVDATIKAFTSVDRELVAHDAAILDQRVASGDEVGSLVGVVLGVKDVFDVAGLPTSASSPTFEPYVASQDSAAVARLRQAGALVLGKTRTSELAWVIPTPPTVNPADNRLISGGSSGGSAAAVGGGLVHAALGNDVGGSIRIPAALCGVAGIKPTYGVVSMAGVLPGAGSFDTGGPLARSISDLRAVLHELVGRDHNYAGSATAAQVAPLRAGLERPRRVQLASVRLGVLSHPVFEVIDPRARAHHDRVLARIEDAGADIVTLTLPEADLVEPAFWTLAPSEGAALHTEKLRSAPAELSEETRRILHFAHAIPAVLAVRAQQARRQLIAAVARVFEEFEIDALLAPGTTAPAIPVDELDTSFQRQDGGRESALWSYGRVFWLANLTGQPSVVIPTADSPPPLAVQLIGRPFRDDALLNVAEAIEELLPL